MKEAEAQPPPEESPEFALILREQGIIWTVLCKRLDDKGAQPGQTVGELITKKEFEDIVTAALLQQQSNTKN